MMKQIMQLLGLMTLWVPALYAQQTYVLRFDPPDQSAYGVAISTSTQMQQNVMGEDQSMKMNYTMDATYRIRAAEPNKKVSITYDRVRMNMDVMGQQLTVDSEKADSSGGADTSFRALKGQTIGILLDPNGKVLEVSGIETLIGNQADQAGASSTLQEVFNEDAIKSMMEQSFGFYPKEAVKVGDSWTTTMSLKQPFAIDFTAHYTLIKVEGQQGFIDISGTLATPDSGKITMNGIEMRLDLNGDVSGSSTVDIPTGMPLSSSLKQLIKGNVEAMDQKIPLAAITEITLQTQKK